MSMIHPPRTGLPCTSWCDREPGHAFDTRSTDLGTLVRIHERDFGDHVSICAEEHAITDDGPVWDVGRPRVELACEEYHLTLEEARQFLADMQAAIYFLDSLS